jgi:hypothetical protein
MEEADLLARSSKKIKVGRGKRPMEEKSTVEEMEGNIAKGGFSYKESLMGSAYLEQKFMEDLQHQNYASEEEEIGEELVIKLSRG